MIGIRQASECDRSAVRDVHLRAFPADEAQQVADLATGLLGEETTPETFALVAQAGDAVVGHVAFSPVEIEGERSGTGYILAPLGVVPDRQHHGVGTGLVEAGKQRLAAKGVKLVLVYGDPAYYGRFGFDAAAAAGYRPPYELQHPFGWQALLLDEGTPPATLARISCVASLCDPRLW